MQDYNKDLIENLAKHLGLEPSDIITVWFSKTIQNAKGLFITKHSPRYFEVTYNGDKEELYIDTYTKVSHHTYFPKEEQN